jgi:methylenetetrahydrofolate reductase (NADPH)
MINEFSISFEFFPPKSADGMKNLGDTAVALAPYLPDFFSVTFGAGGSTRDGTLETLKMLQSKTQIPIAPHISCVGSTKKDLIQLIEQYKELGVKRIVALRGDLPSGMGNVSEMKFASDLVALIRKTTQNYFHIEVAAYPEFHPQARSVLDDVLNLKRKVDAGANSAITQFFYNADAYFYFRDQCAKSGIYIPITPGIMPISQFTKLAQFADMCGAEIPRWMRKRLEAYGDDIQSIREFGLEVVYSLCERLRNGGAPGLHFYTLNRAERSIEVLNLLGITTDHSVLKDNSAAGR